MKKFLFLTLAVASSTLLSAATITLNCDLTGPGSFPTQFSGGVGNGSVTCPGATQALAGLGATSLNSAILKYFVDYTFGGASNTVQGVFTAPNTVNWAVSSTVTSSGGFSSTTSNPSPLPATNLATNATLVNLASNFNVGLAVTVPQGSVGTSSVGVQIMYDYNTPAPEPATISLIGLSLVGLGVIARRRS